MRLDNNIKILTGWCVVSRDAERNIFPEMVQHMRTNLKEEAALWEELLSQLAATRLIRYWQRNKANDNGQTMSLARLTFADNHVLWEGEQIGRVQTYYKATLPHETQARIAYEIFYDRFANYLSQQRHLVILSQSDVHLELFIPAGMADDMANIWQAFVTYSFSAPSLQESFVNLVNTIKLTERGFSALSIPIVSEEQADYLAAFYLANLNSLKKGDQKRERDIAQLEDDLLTADDKDVDRLQKNIAKIQKELATRLERYQPFYDQVEALRQTHTERVKKIETIVSKQFRGRAGTQIAKSGSKIGKCMSDLADMLAMETADYFHLPPLVTSQLPNTETRPGGDSNTKLCYACGQLLKRGQPVYSANKFIFESPSQRLQSAAGQMQPKICGICAAISFISPVKVGSGRLIVRMQPQTDPLNPTQEEMPFGYRVDDQLRMLTMGELNIIAGKYVIMQAGETIGKKLVADQLGGEQYALYKVGISFPAQVFREFKIEAVIDDANVILNGSHLSTIQRLNQVFNFAEKLQSRKRPMPKAHFAAFGRAIRHIQQDDLPFAIYELATSGILSISNGWSLEQSAALENLRKEHVEWLEMSKTTETAQLYKDIAAVTALVYPFCAKVSEGLRGDPSKQRIEVRKIIDRADDPYELMYTVAPQISGRSVSEHEFRSVRVFLSRNPDTYFSYDQLLDLLAELPNQPGKRDSQYENSIPLTLDDLVNCFTHLYATRYASDKERREFTYKLKLSLAARFAQFYEKKESDKE